MAVTRRPIARAAAVATAVALGTAALALPAVAADAPSEAASGTPRTAAEQKAPPAFTITDGTLDWGLKESFRKYVTGMAHGKITADGGAEQAPDNGVFTFTGGKGTYELADHALKAGFKGAVRFTSTQHKFDISIADVKVHTKGKTGAIQADVTLNGAKQNDIDLATLDLSEVRPGQGAGGAMTFKDIPTALTAKGAKAFNGMYQEGQALDPATLTVKTGGPAPQPTPKPTPTKPTSKPTKPTAKPTPTKPTSKPSSGTGGKVVGGKLSWGLKESFRRYISTGGSVQTSGGAKKTSAGYAFPHSKATWNAGAKKVDASFGGSVRFLYKGHGIDMKFSDFKVKARGKTGTLTVDVKAQGRTSDDVKFATLDLSRASYKAKNDVVQLSKVPTRLTAAGAEQFESEEGGAPYKKGDKFDPLTVALTLSAGANIPAPAGGSGDVADSGAGADSAAAGGGSVGGSVGDDGSLAATGASTPSGALLGAAGAVVVAGAGVVYAARRRHDVQPGRHA
ncbi:HtaA domain-containing protein [Streptomyces flavofungini]|uniref:HtaA domain-containing protein n=1 Tax=Streptomyces flavofungini TaxID=68200 RepID=UPI0025AFEBF7|nr:HtaA domain-containing protein [Streptomyces flavofungini]WJV49142.1 HtaA domain-containing protein [Streptomyces flavofungini]